MDIPPLASPQSDVLWKTDVADWAKAGLPLFHVTDVREQLDLAFLYSIADQYGYVIKTPDPNRWVFMRK